MARTEAQIVADANELARKFYALMGYQVESGHRFDRASHPQEIGCWRMACIAFDEIQGTDVEDALNSIED